MTVFAYHHCTDPSRGVHLQDCECAGIRIVSLYGNLSILSIADLYHYLRKLSGSSLSIQIHKYLVFLSNVGSDRLFPGPRLLSLQLPFLLSFFS